VYPGIPQQIGACDRAGLDSEVFEALRGRTSITKEEAVAMVKKIVQRNYPGRNVQAAWLFSSYEGANVEAGQVAFIVGADHTVYKLPAGSAILATTQPSKAA
jgi:hypothetical protein